MLKRLNPTAYKGVNYVISGNSLIFHLCNDSKEALDLLDIRSYTCPVFLDLGAPGILSGRGDSKFPTWNQNFFHSSPLPARSYARYLSRVSGRSIISHPPTTAGLLAFGMGIRIKKCWKRWKWGRMPRNASQKWVKIERWKMHWGVRWCSWIPQNCRRA